jgi:hypothetical protein
MIKADTIEAQFDNELSVGDIKKEKITVSYFPNEDAVCLEFKLEFTTFYQIWTKEGRETFIRALENYKTDYENKSLGKGSQKTRRQYGTVNGYLIWQMLSFTAPAGEAAVIDLGYFFKQKLPYFTINQREVTFKDPSNSDVSKKSQRIPIYFTRAQADRLAELFNQDYLRGLAAGNIPDEVPEIDVDDY